jgi:hypothetical protein
MLGERDKDREIIFFLLWQLSEMKAHEIGMDEWNECELKTKREKFGS